MAKKNLPNIPLYIGDWEKDCNVLSLETEAAWLRIIFKMFTNGKQSTYKIPTKGLQKLWRCSEEKSKEILEELEDYNIANIRYDGRFIEFECRRYVKENNLSETRREAVSQRDDRKSNSNSSINDLQNVNKTPTKHLQNTDNEIEGVINNEINNVGKGGVGEKPLAITEPIKNITDEIAEFFNVNQVTTAKVYFRISALVRANEPDYILTQFRNYKKYKEVSDEKVHSVKTWLGVLDDFSDGAWCECDWTKKLSKVSETRVEKIKDWEAV